VPAGSAALRLQLQEVPFSHLADSAGELDTTQGWTAALARGYAEWVLSRIARHAPDVHDKILAVDMVTPAQLAEYNPNAVNGDPCDGSGELDQSYLWRPLRMPGRHATAIRGLWHVGASTHPGAGLGGGSGHMVAARLTGQPRFARVPHFSGKRRNRSGRA
jgi:phytoene dehydrogenase-like protein